MPYDPSDYNYDWFGSGGDDPNAGYGNGDTFGDDWSNYGDWSGSGDTLDSRQTTPNMGGTIHGLSSGTDYSALAGQGGNAILRMLQQRGAGGNLADLSRLLGGFSQGEKNNRLDRAHLTQNYD